MLKGETRRHDQLGAIFIAEGRWRMRCASIALTRDRRTPGRKVIPRIRNWQRECRYRTTRSGACCRRRDTGQALAEHQADRQIMQRLHERDPENTDWQRDLSYRTTHRERAAGARTMAKARGPEFQAGKADHAAVARSATRRTRTGSVSCRHRTTQSGTCCSPETTARGAG